MTIYENILTENPNLEYKDTPITIQNLLTFKTGIFAEFPDYRELFTKPDDSLAFRVKKAEDNYTKKQFFDALATVKLDTMPGAVYKHTKLGPELCAAILENLNMEKATNLYLKNKYWTMPE